MNFPFPVCSEAIHSPCVPHLSAAEILPPSPQIQAFLQLLSSMDSVKGPPIAKAAAREGTGPEQPGGGKKWRKGR